VKRYQGLIRDKYFSADILFPSGRTMEAIIGEQIEAMDMAGSIDFGSSESFDQTLQWIRKSRTYWTGYIMDAFGSAASRRNPRL
jgi:hypothetical protein